MKAFLAFAAALTLALQAPVAAAAGYGGNWPLTVTHALRSNGAYCLTLVDNGDQGWPHSGEASLTSAQTGYLPYGTWQVMGHDFVVTIQQPGGTGQNAGIVFFLHARDGDLGKGIYDQVYGGEAFDSGETAVGARGGC